LSMNLGRVDILGHRGYVVFADFPTVGGLKSGAAVEIAGVSVGRVQSIGLKDYQARVALRIDDGVKLQTDAIVSIKTKGLIGERFIRIGRGGADRVVRGGGRLAGVEPPVAREVLSPNSFYGKVWALGLPAAHHPRPPPPPWARPYRSGHHPGDRAHVRDHRRARRP